MVRPRITAPRIKDNISWSGLNFFIAACCELRVFRLGIWDCEFRICQVFAAWPANLSLLQPSAFRNQPNLSSVLWIKSEIRHPTSHIQLFLIQSKGGVEHPYRKFFSLLTPSKKQATELNKYVPINSRCYLPLSNQNNTNENTLITEIFFYICWVNVDQIMEWMN